MSELEAPVFKFFLYGQPHQLGTYEYSIDSDVMDLVESVLKLALDTGVGGQNYLTFKSEGIDGTIFINDGMGRQQRSEIIFPPKMYHLNHRNEFDFSVRENVNGRMIAIPITDNLEVDTVAENLHNLELEVTKDRYQTLSTTFDYVQKLNMTEYQIVGQGKKASHSPFSLIFTINKL